MVSEPTSSTIPPYHPSQPEPTTLPTYDLASIPDEEEDRPFPGEEIAPTPKGAIPPVVLGAATFGYGIYSSDDAIASAMPLRVVRLALRSGMTAIDTAPYYHPSEVIVGNALWALRHEHPRESYTLITKVGRYGSEPGHWVYDAETVTQSVERSLERLKTDYLDVVYLHDPEFIVGSNIPASNPLSLLSSSPSAPSTPGDPKLLEGLGALRVLQSQGKIRRVGIAGYPLPVLLRLAHLIQRETAQPLDIVQTYANQTVQNPALAEGYLRAFEDAGVALVTNAAPLAMGLLTASGGPSWHPARKDGKVGLWEGCQAAARRAEELGGRIEEVASRVGYRKLRMGRTGETVPVVIGCKDLAEVHRALKGFASANGGESEEEREKADRVEKEVVKVLEEQGVRGLSWTCVV